MAATKIANTVTAGEIIPGTKIEVSVTDTGREYRPADTNSWYLREWTVTTVQPHRHGVEVHAGTSSMVLYPDTIVPLAGHVLVRKENYSSEITGATKVEPIPALQLEDLAPDERKLTEWEAGAPVHVENTTQYYWAALAAGIQDSREEYTITEVVVADWQEGSITYWVMEQIPGISRTRAQAVARVILAQWHAQAQAALAHDRAEAARLFAIDEKGLSRQD